MGRIFGYFGGEIAFREADPLTVSGASINVGTWAKVAKANNRPTAVKTLLSMMPIGGQMKPPMMRRILVINVM